VRADPPRTTIRTITGIITINPARVIGPDPGAAISFAVYQRAI